MLAFIQRFIQKTRLNPAMVKAIAHSPIFAAIIQVNDRKKAMAEITLDETKLKELLKAAILELMQEQKEEFSQILAESLEDIEMANAIKEGETTETVSREVIFNILKQTQ